jgi:hypothetical protein
MEPEFITYQKFNDPALADELSEQLKSHEINNIIVAEAHNFNPSFAFDDESSTYYTVKISADDFERANEFLKADESEDVSKIGSDYYLFAFTDDELLDVITKADEWSSFDVVLSRKILAERGKILSDETIAAIEQKRIEELRKPDAPQTSWIIIGYVVAFLGGIFGIFIGWHLMTYKKTLPDGERVYEYTHADRKNGKRIFYISTIVLILAIIYRLSGIFTGN